MMEFCAGLNCLKIILFGFQILFCFSSYFKKKNLNPFYLISFRTLQGHGHWVNVLALNTDYVMRTGAFDPAKATLVHENSGTPPKSGAFFFFE